MIEKCTLEILDIDSDGNATSKIQNNLLNNDIINIFYKSDNIVFKIGDFVSALIKKQNKKIKILKILKNLNKSSLFYGVVLKNNTKYITLKKLPYKNEKYYYAINSEVNEELINLIKEGVLIKVKEDLSKATNYKNYAKNKCKILNVFGKLNEFHLYPLIAIDEFNIDYKFSNEELKEAKKLTLNDDLNRVNLQKLPFVTIDGEDAKDFDDAVYAEKINDQQWKIIVSIADVSFYVKENSILDKKAKLRGNSVYFPNMVIPMFPEEISNNLCSLKENEKKLCLSVEIIITNDGEKISHKFYKSSIKPKKRFTYEQIENLIKSNFSNKTILDQKFLTSLKNLYYVFKILKKQSIQRGCLELKISDKKFLFDKNYTSIDIREIKSTESHQLIEEFMILANVCAAEEISKADNQNIYRVHEKPTPEKISNLIKLIGKPYDKILKNKISTASFNHLIKKLQNEMGFQSVSQIILRSQSQAKYFNINKGHFGLALKNYVHFTSPIRRYSDLLIHRKLDQIINNYSKIKICSQLDLKPICEHISKTERIAIQAERKTSDRLISYIFSKKINETFIGNIISIKNFGVFISINNGIVEGLIQKKNLPKDRYVYNEKNETLKGSINGIVFKTGLRLQVSIRETDILNGNLSFNFLKII